MDAVPDTRREVPLDAWCVDKRREVPTDAVPHKSREVPLDGVLINGVRYR